MQDNSKPDGTITKIFKKDYGYCTYPNDGHRISPRSEGNEKISLLDIETKRNDLCHMVTELVQDYEKETQTGIYELEIIKAQDNKLSTRFVIAKTSIW